MCTSMLWQKQHDTIFKYKAPSYSHVISTRGVLVRSYQVIQKNRKIESLKKSIRCHQSNRKQISRSNGTYVIKP